MTRVELVSLAKARAAAANVNAALVCAVCEQESAWDPWASRFEPTFYERYIVNLKLGSATEAYSRAFSWGLMQIMGETAREDGYHGPFPALCDPQTGLDMGIEHLRRMLVRSGGNMPIALNLWNGGADHEYAAQVLARVPKY